MSSTTSVSHDGLIVCACGKQEYTARDAIDAAIFRGELEIKWKEFLRVVEAEKRADELDLDLDESAISSAAEAFRYEHDLITAEETEAWLGTQGLTVDEFIDHFSRQQCASALGDELIPAETEYHSASPELRELFVVELILSGELDRLTTALMWRLAAACVESEPHPKAIGVEERKFFDRNEIEPARLASAEATGRWLANWLEGLGRDSNWFNGMLAIEAAYRATCERLLTAEARRHELRALRLPLTRFETEIIELESHDAASEALLCVQEDGMLMEEVAAEGRYPYQRSDFLLEDVPLDAQQRFLSASAGDVLEPIARGDGFELCRILNKIEPQADDPDAKSRIDQRLLDRHFSELTSKYTERRLGGASTSAE
jgi:hypothetical protein